MDIRSETKLVTPEEAAWFRVHCHFERQRDIDKRHVEQLRIEMDRRRFIEGTQIFFCVLPGGAMVVVNGNHTLEAVAALGRPYLLSLCYRPVRDLDEAGAIYARFDIQKVRSWRAALRARGLDSLLGNDKWTQAFASAAAHMLQGFVTTQGNKSFDIEIAASRDIRVDAMRDMREYGELYVAACDGGVAECVRYLRRSAVMAVGLELFRYQPSTAHAFVLGIAADDGLRIGDPRKAIITYLRNNPAQNQTARIEQSKAVALAWNAYFSNRALEVCKPNAMGEFRLSGTPWNKSFDPIAAYLPHLRPAVDGPISELRKVEKKPGARGSQYELRH